MNHEAKVLTNQLFYRNGPQPQLLLPSDAVLVADTFDKARHAVIEECAKVVIEFCEWSSKVTHDDVANVAAAIRALKDKQP